MAHRAHPVNDDSLAGRGIPKRVPETGYPMEAGAIPQGWRSAGQVQVLTI